MPGVERSPGHDLGAKALADAATTFLAEPATLIRIDEQGSKLSRQLRGIAGLDEAAALGAGHYETRTTAYSPLLTTGPLSCENQLVVN